MPEFTDKYHPRVKRDLRKIDKAVESELKDHHIPKLKSTIHNITHKESSENLDDPV